MKKTSTLSTTHRPAEAVVAALKTFVRRVHRLMFDLVDRASLLRPWRAVQTGAARPLVVNDAPDAQSLAENQPRLRFFSAEVVLLDCRVRTLRSFTRAMSRSMFRQLPIPGSSAVGQQET
jgi:hypothetical protein